MRPQFVAISGLLLDTALFVVLGFFRPGTKYQIVTLVFHTFTAFTMSQRIGYAFPIAMGLSSLLFQPIPGDPGDRKRSHYQWVLWQLTGDETIASRSRSQQPAVEVEPEPAPAHGHEQDKGGKRGRSRQPKSTPQRARPPRSLCYVVLLWLAVQCV